MSELIIEKKQENETLTVFVEGRIDAVTSPQLDNEVKASLEGVTKVILNFEKVNYISSSGLRVLLSLHKTMSARSGELVVFRPTEMVLEVFEVTGFIDKLNIEN